MTPRLRQGQGRRPRPTGSPGRAGFKPITRRQILLAGAALAVILLGYFVGTLFADHGSGPSRSNETSGDTAGASEPWYRKQAPPPELVTLPDAPIFPEPGDEPATQPVRAYEEALPVQVYEAVAARALAPETTRPAPSRPERRPAADPPEGRVTPPVQDAQAPWRRFARASPETNGRPTITVVLDDLGVDRKRTARAIGLRAPLTLSFLTYASGLERQAASARALGHELLVHVPMEPVGKNVDPGPNVLITGMDRDAILRRLDWGLNRFSAYVGVNNHMGSRFTADRDGMAVVMAELKRRGLLFLDSRTTRATVGPALAREYEVPLAQRNVFLDNVNTLAAVNARLEETEELARRRGFAVAIGHPRDATLQALEMWLAALPGRGFVLVPLSAIIARPGVTG